MEIEWISRGTVVARNDNRSVHIGGEYFLDHHPDFLIYARSVTAWDDGTPLSDPDRRDLLAAVVNAASLQGWNFEISWENFNLEGMVERALKSEEVRVNDLRLPLEMTRALRDGRWVSLSMSRSLEENFGVEPYMPNFYTLEEIVRINENWRDEVDPRCLGEADPLHYPGDIDPRRSLVVAQLRPNRLLALDYRRSVDPEILVATDHSVSPWKVVFGSIEELLSELS